MDILLRDSLSRVKLQNGGEFRLLCDSRVAPNGATPEGAWEAFADLVYLGDTRLQAHGQAKVRTHDGADRLLLVMEGGADIGRDADDGLHLDNGEIWVQCPATQAAVSASGNGCRMIQLSILSAPGQVVEDRKTRPEAGRVTSVYGGPDAGGSPRTRVDLAHLQAGQSIDVDKPALVYLCDGAGFANDDNVTGGALLRVDGLTFDAIEDTRLIIVHAD